MLGCLRPSLTVKRLPCWLSGSPRWLLVGGGSLQAHPIWSAVLMLGERASKETILDLGTCMFARSPSVQQTARPGKLGVQLHLQLQRKCPHAGLGQTAGSPTYFNISM